MSARPAAAPAAGASVPAAGRAAPPGAAAPVPLAPASPPADFAADAVRPLADAMRAAVRDGSLARTVVPAREVMENARGDKFLSMPARSDDHGLFVNKTATIMAPGADGSRTTVTSVVTVFSTVTGALLAVLDGGLVTNLKCAAVSALVTDRCAAPGSRVLGIVGSGVQAWQQYLAVSAVRDLDEVRVHSRDPERARAFGDRVAAAHGPGLRVRVCGSAAEATRGADIVATATTSTQPLPLSPDLPAHAHVNCMGAHTTESRELPRSLLRSGVLIVEDTGVALAEAGESHRGALDLTALEQRDPAELAGERTIFGSTGVASLDLVTCAHIIALEQHHER